MSDDNGICLFCGVLLTFPEGALLAGLRVLKLDLQDRYGLKSSYEGPMFCCFDCYDRLHDSLEANAQLNAPK
jgi:hypothetical protein